MKKNVTDLKAIAYDLYTQINQLQGNLGKVNEAIQIKNQAETKKDKK